jgi:hypothetical protein
VKFFNEPGLTLFPADQQLTSLSLSFDFMDHLKIADYYTFSDAVFNICFALPIACFIVFSILSLFNMINYYGHLTDIIHRRYKDAQNW